MTEVARFLVLIAALTGSFVVADKLVDTNFSPADVLLAGILLLMFLGDGNKKT